MTKMMIEGLAWLNSAWALLALVLCFNVYCVLHLIATEGIEALHKCTWFGLITPSILATMLLGMLFVLGLLCNGFLRTLTWLCGRARAPAD